jgi:O-antigen/teichoic acid export membrane protein
MRNRQLVINSIYYTIGEILPRIIGFFLLPLLTRYLTPAEYGINSYTNAVMIFSLVLSTLSLNTFLLRNYYKEGTEADKKRIIGNIFLLMLITNAVITALELLLFPGALVLLKIGIPFRPFFLLAILNNFMEGISVIPLIIYRIRQNARLFVLINAGRLLGQFVVTYFLLSRFHYGLTGVYLARLFVSIPFTLLFLGIVYRNALFRPDRNQMWKALRFSLPLMPGVLSYLFISTFDRIVLEKNVGLEILGLYSTAATLSLALNIIVQGLYRAFEQKIFEKHGGPEYQRVTDELYRYFLACLIGGGFMLSLFSREVFLFFTTSRYLPAYTLVPWLAVPVILSGITTFLATLGIADHRQTVITKGTILSVAVTIPGTLILIRVMGVRGAILSSVLSFAILVFYYLYHLRLKRSFALSWTLLLLLLLGACQAVQTLRLPLLSMILVKAGLSVAYLGLCAVCFKIKLP